MKCPPDYAPQGIDATAYVRSIGYVGAKPVIVQDGKVTSHRRMDYFVFCRACRRGYFARQHGKRPRVQTLAQFIADHHAAS